MKTRNAMLGIALLAVATGGIASCKKKEGDKKDNKDDMSAMDDMDTMEPMARTTADMGARPAPRAGADLAKTLQDKGLIVAPIKLEGYLNIDAGTLNL